MSDITCSFGFGSGKFWMVSNILPGKKDLSKGRKDILNSGIFLVTEKQYLVEKFDTLR